MWKHLKKKSLSKNGENDENRINSKDSELSSGLKMALNMFKEQGEMILIRKLHFYIDSVVKAYLFYHLVFKVGLSQK